MTLYITTRCVSNGRFGLTSNKYTFVPTRGSAVVDSNADMHLLRQLKISNMNKIAVIVKHFISDKCRILDHYLFLCNVMILCYNQDIYIFHNKVENIS